MPKAASAGVWIPERQDIIWIDCNPQAGQEMRDIHPFLVLSPKIFNDRTSLVIGLPMTTAEYNADNPFAVAVGKTSKETPINSSHRRKPVSSSLIFLDSGLRRNDEFSINQRFPKRKIEQTSYVLCHQPKSFDWRVRSARPHPLRKIRDSLFAEVCERLNQIIQLS